MGRGTSGRVRAHRVTGRGPYVGAYEYTVGFTSTVEIAVALARPTGVALLFGRAVGPGRKPDRMRVSYTLEREEGRLVRLEISGALRFRLPRGLVRPVVERDRRWVDDAKRRNVVVPLGNAAVVLGHRQPPRVSAPLSPPAVDVRIGRSSLVGNLGFATLDIAGTSAAPTLRFRGVRLAHLRS